VVDSERYLLICLRYIESNPVRAGMVRHPSQFPWSSYGTNAEGKPSDFLLPREEYSALAADPEERRRVYRSLFDTPIPPVVLDQIRAATNGGFALGSETFIHDLERRTGVGAAPKRGGRPSRRVA
jgi:putative transposase